MKSKIINIITWIIILIMLFVAFTFYKNNNFNEFIKSEMELNTSEFKRDNEIKYSKSNSYKIASNTVNDATFYKKVKVQKNTPYKVIQNDKSKCQHLNKTKQNYSTNAELKHHMT